MSERVRFAPSPTGRLHPGSVRTALFNYLYARKHSGAFILRIEDTDRARSKKEFEESFYSDLLWLGLDWDEGPDKGGGSAPYRQSEREKIYIEHARKLLKEKKAYYCDCTQERLDEVNEERKKRHLPPRYDNKCRSANLTAIEGKTVLRFMVPDAGSVRFADAVHGSMEFECARIGDFIVMASDNTPSYNFAAAVDDSLMGITRVIRGDDHLSNTPRQILLIKALGLNPPEYAHLPLVGSGDKTPLSKRMESLSIKALREDGFLPEGIVNAVSRLGWAIGEEGGKSIFTLKELAERFSLDKISKAPGMFDESRLRSLNKEAIAASDNKKLLELIKDGGFGGIPDDMLLRVVEAAKDSAETLNELKILITPLVIEVQYSNEVLEELKKEGARSVLGALRNELEKTEVFMYKSVIETLKKTSGLKGKELFIPVRLALTGSESGLELEKIFSLLGRKRLLGRIKKFTE